MRASSSSAASTGSSSSPSSRSAGSISRDLSSSRAAIRTRNSVAASRSSSPARSRCSTYASTTSARSTSRRSISSFSTSVRSRSKGPWKTSRSRSSEAIAIAGRLVVQTDGLVVLAFAVELLHRLRRIALARRGARGNGLLDAQQILRGQLERERAERLVKAVPAARANERHDVVAARQHPGDRHLGDAHALRLGNAAQGLDERQVAVEVLAPEARAEGAEVALRELALGGPVTRQQAA